MTYHVAPIGDDVLIARLVEITPAEAINDDGGHNRVILATFTGNLNAPDVNVVDVAELPVERMRVLLLADTADRIVDGLNRAIAVAGTDPDPTPLDGWIDAVRLSAADRLGDLDVTDRRAAADDLFDQLAGQMNITLDRPTLRTMAFTLAAVQALQVVTSPVPPDDPGFAAGVVDVMGRAIDLVVRRYDDAGETHRP